MVVVRELHARLQIHEMEDKAMAATAPSPFFQLAWMSIVMCHVQHIVSHQYLFDCDAFVLRSAYTKSAHTDLLVVDVVALVAAVTMAAMWALFDILNHDYFLVLRLVHCHFFRLGDSWLVSSFPITFDCAYLLHMPSYLVGSFLILLVFDRISLLFSVPCELYHRPPMGHLDSFLFHTYSQHMGLICMHLADFVAYYSLVKVIVADCELAHVA